MGVVPHTASSAVAGAGVANRPVVGTKPLPSDVWRLTPDEPATPTAHFVPIGFNRAQRRERGDAPMRVDLLTKEYPPFIYGGAGVHVNELAKVLRPLADVRVRAFGGLRRGRI